MTENIVLLKIKDFINGEKAVSSDDGDILFGRIVEEIKSGSIVELDFSGIIIMTTAFLNSAIGQLYSIFSSEQLNKSIKLINVENEDKILFKKVIDRAKEFFANRKGFEDSADNAIYGH
ncbi:MAG TPA: STAS-like domain-containing protein [Ignavibacteria bacterium]